MQTKYNFSTAKCTKDVAHLTRFQEAAGRNKARITLDNDVIERFKSQVGPSGDYQTEINHVLREHLSESTPVTSSEALAALDTRTKTVQKTVLEAVRKELRPSYLLAPLRIYLLST